MSQDSEPHYLVDTQIWRWTPEPPAKDSWHFVTITGEAANAIRLLSFERRALGGARGFGAVRLRLTLDGVEFETSAFPQKESDGYMIPIKAAVRKAAGVGEGDAVQIGIWT